MSFKERKKLGKTMSPSEESKIIGFFSRLVNIFGRSCPTNLDAADKIPPRRSAVSAECTSIHEVSSFNLKAVKKSNEARERIENALRKSYLFISLDKEQTKIIVDAVEEIKFKAGNTIIEQGASGDHFYLLEEGECEAWIKFSEGEPKMVKNYVAGDSFGELALLYNSPRAATVKATTDCVLGAVDRNMFRAIVMITTREKRELYEEFLEDVPILKTLTKYERSTIADILQEEYFESGETIIVEGQKGDKMYFLEDGEAEAQTSGKVVMKYKRGDYFGELALLDDKPRQATVIAVTKCKCASIDRDSFKRLFGKVEDTMKERKLAIYDNQPKKLDRVKA